MIRSYLIFIGIHEQEGWAYVHVAMLRHNNPYQLKSKSINNWIKPIAL